MLIIVNYVKKENKSQRKLSFPQCKIQIQFYEQKQKTKQKIYSHYSSVLTISLIHLRNKKTHHLVSHLTI